MRHWRLSWEDVGILACSYGGIVGGIVGGVIGCFAGFGVFFFVSGVIAEGVDRVGFIVAQRSRHHRPKASAGIRTVRPQAPKSLRWVRGLLPGEEGTAWLAEVASCLAETPDKRVRRRFARSYRRGVPRLIWTSWAEYLSASRRKELS
jgi:hypothetical protein